MAASLRKSAMRCHSTPNVLMSGKTGFLFGSQSINNIIPALCSQLISTRDTTVVDASFMKFPILPLKNAHPTAWEDLSYCPFQN